MAAFCFIFCGVAHTQKTWFLTQDFWDTEKREWTQTQLWQGADCWLMQSAATHISVQPEQVEQQQHIGILTVRLPQKC